MRVGDLCDDAESQPGSVAFRGVARLEQPVAFVGRPREERRERAPPERRRVVRAEQVDRRRVGVLARPPDGDDDGVGGGVEDRLGAPLRLDRLAARDGG